MGFTPLGGLVMGTRPGDLDPGVLLYLLQERGVPPDALADMLSREAGMLGVSGRSADMRDLLDQANDDPHAAEAVALFTYQARKYLGALAAAMGGVDRIVFTGGIGEHAAPVRSMICAGLEHLGVVLDAGRNAAHASRISRDTSRVLVQVLATDEERVIAEHTRQVLLATEQGGCHD
jgi:acetate kinase